MRVRSEKKYRRRILASSKRHKKRRGIYWEGELQKRGDRDPEANNSHKFAKKNGRTRALHSGSQTSPALSSRETKDEIRGAT